MTPKQVLALPSLEQGSLRKLPHSNPLEVDLQGLLWVPDTSEWACAADYYSYDLKMRQAGVVIGVLRYKGSPFCVYRNQVVGPDIERQTWALTDRWDEHMLTIDAFNLPDPPPKPVTPMDEDVIVAPPKWNSVLQGAIL